jgi:uncharacterized repeat protein (TIGR03803 family)
VIPLLLQFFSAVAFISASFGHQAGAVLTTVHSFQAFTNGANPVSPPIPGNDGYFYGTTGAGGTSGGVGTVFRISTNGAVIRLYSFTGGNDGAYPNQLLLGSDGYFYDTTASGGTNNSGTVFKISTNGVLTSLHSFNGSSEGAYTQSGLALGSDGNLYGMTEFGGTNGYGTIFKITTNGALTTLYSFTGGDDGATPYGGPLVLGSDGNFYGTTYQGGQYGAFSGGYGAVFKIGTNGALTSLHSFTDSADGALPQAGLTLGADGNFYGTTAIGGDFKGGTVFQITPGGAFTPLYSFTGGGDGGYPYAGLVQGGDSNFYGTTEVGGASGDGTVFQISSNSAFASLYSFTGGDDGKTLFAGLVRANGGTFYGATYGGGTEGGGTVFQINSDGALTNLYSFPGVNDGANPKAGLAQGSDGNFYGTTYSGGTNNAGTVFQMSVSGALTSLYSFTGGGDGGDPIAGLTQGSDGNFYGTTESGGASGHGTVFQISTNGAFTPLYSFTGGSDGASPQGGLVRGSDGYFYGTTASGGASQEGTVFQISPSGAVNTLYAFTGGADGGLPENALVQGSDGILYGTTTQGGTNYAGTVFEITTNESLTTLYTFTGFAGQVFEDYPNGLVLGSDGNLYGTTFGYQYGPDFGTAFKIAPDGLLTILHAFTGRDDGGNPIASLTQGTDGNFYGTTTIGGTHNNGTVFQITTNGSLATLFSFTGGFDGAQPRGSLIQGSDGSFYGTAYMGGEGGSGTVFRLTIEPAFLSMEISANALTLTWSAEAGAKYQLQANSDLSSSNWTSLGSPVTAMGTTLQRQDSITNAAQRFYRLMLVP